MISKHERMVQDVAAAALPFLGDISVAEAEGIYRCLPPVELERAAAAVWQQEHEANMARAGCVHGIVGRCPACVQPRPETPAERHRRRQ